LAARRGRRPALTAVPHRGTTAGADRRRVAMTETALTELLSRDLSGLDVAAS
jgi:hypothetical protein